MARGQGKSSKGFGNFSAREHVKSLLTRPARGMQRRGNEPAPDGLLAALAGIPGGATASQLAANLNRQSDSREIASVLRRMVEQGQVLEVRPGRYQVSGTGGEFPVVLQAGVSGGMQARFADSKLMPVNPRYTLGARVGDVVQVVVGEDQQALITRILRRTGREVVGLVNFRPGGPVLIPDNRREGELPVLSTFPRFDTLYHAGDRVVGTIEIAPSGSAGVNLTRILSEETPEIADFRYVCLVHDLPGEFPAEVEAQAKAYRDELPLGNREDLRQKLVFTIDPATAKDFDDAISLERDQEGRQVLGVHIADVSHYVIEHTPLDAEAAQRGTSIYLINRVIPMLPESLSNGLCSLVPRRDRYCLSAFLTIDRQGKLVHTRLAETIICSRHRFTYEEALAVLEKRDPPGQWPDDVRTVLHQVNDIAQGLRRAREQAGALNLFSVEHRFNLDVNGVPIDVEREGTDISHQLIEECMLLANRAVAEWLEQHQLPCVYRVHEQPDEERMKVFAHMLEAYGLDSSRIQNRFGLQKLLGDLAKEPPAARLVLNYLCLRSFKKAVYSVDNIGHHALAFTSYAHFTSPIRRYPDLLVHRLVKRGLGLNGYKNVEIRRGYLDALAKQSSNLEARAEGAERDLHARKSARYLATRMGEIFPGVVTTASPGGLQVQLMETGMEGFVPMRELKDDFYSFDAERFCLVGRHSGRIIGIGQEIDVQVAAVDIARGDVVLALTDEGRRPGGPNRNARPGGERRSEPSGERRPETRRVSKGGTARTSKPAKHDERRAKHEAKRAERKQRRAEARRKRGR